MKFCPFWLLRTDIIPIPLWVPGTVLSDPLDFSFSGLGSFPHMHSLLCTQYSRETSSALQVSVFAQLSTLDYLGFLGLLATSPPIRQTTGICLYSASCTMAWRLSPSSELEQSGVHFLFLSSKIIAFWCVMYILGAIISYNLSFFFFSLLKFQVEVRWR